MWFVFWLKFSTSEPFFDVVNRYLYESAYSTLFSHSGLSSRFIILRSAWNSLTSFLVGFDQGIEQRNHVSLYKDRERSVGKKRPTKLWKIKRVGTKTIKRRSFVTCNLCSLVFFLLLMMVFFFFCFVLFCFVFMKENRQLSCLRLLPSQWHIKQLPFVSCVSKKRHSHGIAPKMSYNHGCL